jgi:hypothetical protein
MRSVQAVGRNPLMNSPWGIASECQPSLEGMRGKAGDAGWKGIPFPDYAPFREWIYYSFLPCERARRAYCLVSSGSGGARRRAPIPGP